MSTVRKLNESALRGIYDAYMHEAFPPAELKPLAVMLRLMERGRYLCYGYYRNGRRELQNEKELEKIYFYAVSVNNDFYINNSK